MASMDVLIKWILAEMPDPVSEGQQFTDLVDQTPLLVRLPANKPWHELINDGKHAYDFVRV